MRTIKILASILALCVPVLTTYAKSDQELQHKEQDSVLLIRHKAAILNPERGYHLESNYFVHNLKNPFHPYVYPQGWINDLGQKYGSQQDQLSVLQLYLYLTDYVGKDIPKDGFDKMQMLFDEVQKSGFKTVLRFAYDNDYGSTKANFDDVFRHLKQLEPFIKKNIGLIDIWQMGFIGAWGEGHSSPMSNDYVNKSKMVKQLLDMFPDRQTTIRYPDQKNKLILPDAYMRRIGYNNDYFTASEHPKAPDNDFVLNTPVYEQVRKESPYVQVIGEIPYAEATEWGLHTLISVPNTLKILRDQHFSLFDITQNNELNIQNWKNTSLSPALLKSLGILYDEHYFVEDGKTVGRSAYEFIRDHLGYRLYLEKNLTKLSVSGNQVDFDIAIKNVGFSSPHNPRPLYLVLIDDKDNIVHQQKLQEDPRNWQPFDPATANGVALIHKIKGQVNIRAKGTIRVGLWLPDPVKSLQDIPSYSIQLANEEMEVWKGKTGQLRVNIVGKIKF